MATFVAYAGLIVGALGLLAYLGGMMLTSLPGRAGEFFEKILFGGVALLLAGIVVLCVAMILGAIFGGLQQGDGCGDCGVGGP